MFLEWRQIFRQIDDVMSAQILFQNRIHDLNFIEPSISHSYTTILTNKEFQTVNSK